MNDHITTQGLLANPTIGIEISDSEGRIIESNSTFRKLVGYDENELSALTVGDLCHSDDIECELHERCQLIAGNLDHLTFRKRYLTKSGKTLWGDTNITIVRDHASGCNALVATVTDVTSLRRQELLQQGQARVLELLNQNHSLETICVAIVESIELVENGILCSILGLNATTGTLHKIAAPSLPDFYNDAIDGMAMGEGVGSCGTAAYRKQRVVIADILNHPFWAKVRRLVEKTTLRSCWSQPIFDNDGSVLGTFAIYYTEPREPGPFELELINSAADLTALAIKHKRALSELLKSNQLKGEFISTAAHELRTPVSSVMGFAELLLDDKLSMSLTGEQRREYLQEINENCGRLDRIIDDLLDVARIDAGKKIPLDRQPTSIVALLEKLINCFNLKGQDKLNLEIMPGIPETIMVDRHRIRQVIENLVSNAIKYSPEESAISIIVERDDCHCEVTVVDRGIGMTKEQVDHVFDKFYRVDGSDTAVRGLGLGMSIVKQVIEDHGGMVWIDSLLGAGSSVHFTLPVVTKMEGS